MRSRLASPTGKDLVLRPVGTNAGIEAEYRRRLKKLIAEMQASIVYWLGSAYKANAPAIAQDETPASVMRGVMRKLSQRWMRNFNEGAEKLAVWFAQKTKDRSPHTRE